MICYLASYNDLIISIAVFSSLFTLLHVEATFALQNVRL